MGNLQSIALSYKLSNDYMSCASEDNDNEYDTAICIINDDKSVQTINLSKETTNKYTQTDIQTDMYRDIYRDTK